MSLRCGLKTDRMVVSISLIQVRRGKKDSENGIEQGCWKQWGSKRLWTVFGVSLLVIFW